MIIGRPTHPRLVQAVHRLDAPSHASSNVYHVGGTFEPRILERGFREENFINREQSLLVVDEEVKQVLSVPCSELVELDAPLGHLGQLLKRLFKLGHLFVLEVVAGSAISRMDCLFGFLASDLLSAVNFCPESPPNNIAPHILDTIHE